MQVLDNLLSNAVNNSPLGSSIHVAVARQDVHVEFSVTDRGRGLDANVLPQLFRKFSRIDGNECGRDLEGSGLGLAICKGIVEAHGGRIRAESDGPGTGARFAFTLPVASESGSSAMEQRHVTPVGSRHAGHDRIRVLAVDDDPQTLRYVRETFSAAGYDSIVTGDPEQVASLMEKEKPHLVLLDLVFPGLDGIELMETVPELSEVPVIFLSAYGRDQTIARALRAGATDYVVKPFSPTELVARVQTALRRNTVAWREGTPEPYGLADLTVNYEERTVLKADRPVRLTDLEYRVLAELSLNAGKVLSHDVLWRRVWGSEPPARPGPLRTVVKNLRSKLGDDADNSRYIQTEPRVGYRMPKPS